MKSHGFTLVELLVVIAILSILATIGYVTYYGMNSKARDSARRADIHEISTALEVNKTDQGYIPLQVGQFSSFQWVDPSGNVYCIGAGNPADPPVSSAWGATCPSGFASVSPGFPVGYFANWKICTFIENSGSAFCKSSRQ